MTRRELEQVWLCLKKIKQPNEFANEAIACIERDIARRKQQSKDQKEVMQEDTWPFSYGG
jgi:hypothetical protein